MSGYTEACSCGRTGDITEREPLGTAGEPVLRCPRCGHLDTLRWLGPVVARSAWREAVERQARISLALTDRRAA